ncbi:uncharacterized protein LOC135927173 [Gordionus sp. m RMFG-2023]|uniref:uncharacterized protein LOC135927173 n=1 Tax=Gordionus sp. m RMFG-2023 TaxID=3053472 RepID=UPI0031FC3B1E
MPHKDKKNVWPRATQSWERIHVDFFDFENKIYILMVDAYLKWVEYEEVMGLTTQVVVKTLKNLWARFGVARTIVYDGGPAFISEQFKMFCVETGVKHISAAISSQFKWTDGEDGVNCQKLVKKIKVWRWEIWITVSYYNNSRKEEEQSPAEKFLGRRTRILLDLLKPKLHQEVEREIMERP